MIIKWLICQLMENNLNVQFHKSEICYLETIQLAIY